MKVIPTMNHRRAAVTLDELPCGDTFIFQGDADETEAPLYMAVSARRTSDGLLEVGTVSVDNGGFCFVNAKEAVVPQDAEVTWRRS